MIYFTFSKEAERWEASSLIQGFPTLTDYLTPFEGSNIRAPYMNGEMGYAEEEDLDAQDEILAACGLKKAWVYSRD